MLGQLFLVACAVATLSIAAIFFILFGPVPVKRSVVVVPRLSRVVTANPLPSLAAQLAPAREQHFTPSFATTIQGAPPAYAAAPASHASPTPPPLPIATTPVVRRPKGAKVQPMPRKRAAKGTDSPCAPVVRSRQVREEDARTNPVRRVATFESEEFTTVDDA